MSPCSDFVALFAGCAFQQSAISLKQESAGTTSWVYDFIVVVDLTADSMMRWGVKYCPSPCLTFAERNT